MLETGTEKSGKCFIKFDRQAIYQTDAAMRRFYLLFFICFFSFARRFFYRLFFNLFFGFCGNFCSLSPSVIKPVNQVFKILSVVAGGLIFIRGEKGWLKGIIYGLAAVLLLHSPQPVTFFSAGVDIVLIILKISFKVYVLN